MSKVDALRALREARYSAPPRAKVQPEPAPSAAGSPAGTSGPSAAGSPAGTSTGKKSVTAKRVETKPAVTVELPEVTTDLVAAGAASDGLFEPVSPTTVADMESEESEPGPALCGHRSMGNKSCSRPAGHSEKNHRYK